MKRTYEKPKVVHVDFHYDVQVKAESTGTGGGENTAPFGDPNSIGRCQQSDPASCTYFWTAGSSACQSAPFSLR